MSKPGEERAIDRCRNWKGAEVSRSIGFISFHFIPSSSDRRKTASFSVEKFHSVSSCPNQEDNDQQYSKRHTLKASHKSSHLDDMQCCRTYLLLANVGFGGVGDEDILQVIFFLALLFLFSLFLGILFHIKHHIHLGGLVLWALQEANRKIRLRVEWSSLSNESG